MMRYSMISLGTLASALVLAASTTPAFAQDAKDPPKAVTVSGSIAVVSDYRLRGISQTDKNAAIQGGITISHESGLYLSTWGSNLSGWGTFGGANVELDGIVGYKHPVGGGGIDVGVTWYTYPGGFDNSDVFEGFARLSGTTGPVTLTAGAYYAPKQESLGNFSNTRNSRGQKQDNLYLTGDAAGALPSTPVTLKAHVGYSHGNPGLGPNGTSLAPTGEYLDWSLGADITVFDKLTFNVSYIDTDIGRRESAYLQPNFSKGQDGTGQIADPTVVFSVSTSF